MSLDLPIALTCSLGKKVKMMMLGKFALNGCLIQWLLKSQMEKFLLICLRLSEDEIRLSPSKSLRVFMMIWYISWLNSTISFLCTDFYEMCIYAVSCAINRPSPRRNTFVDIEMNSSIVMTKLNTTSLKEIVEAQGFSGISLRNMVYTKHLAFCDVLSGAVI